MAAGSSICCLTVVFVLMLYLLSVHCLCVVCPVSRTNGCVHQSTPARNASLEQRQMQHRGYHETGQTISHPADNVGNHLERERERESERERERGREREGERERERERERRERMSEKVNERKRWDIRMDY